MAVCFARADRTGDCRNCGEKGHQQKDCGRKKYCPMCNMTGHYAGTGGCPEMRHALRMAREAAENRDAYKVNSHEGKMQISYKK